MEAFSVHTGIAAPLPFDNIDTDQIYPQRFLRRIDRELMDQYLFHGLRFDTDGNPRAEFILNQAPYDHASVLIAGNNFGSGSSREHAPWALKAFGFRCLIAPLFADIFKSNCINNGIVPVTLPETDTERCLAAAADAQRATFTIDLLTQQVRHPDLGTLAFSIEPANRERLLKGNDLIDETLLEIAHIEAHERTVAQQAPWLNLSPSRR